MRKARRTWAWVDGKAMEITPRQEVIELRAAVERFLAAPRRPARALDISEELVQLRHLHDLLELDFARRATEFAATDQFEQEGFVSPAEWIRHVCKMSRRNADNAIFVGEQEHVLPTSVAALDQGDIGFAHLALMASTARDVRESPSASGFDEAPLLEKAREHSVGRFRHDCAHARHAADAKAVLDEHVEAVEARYLELQTRDDGAVFLRGFLDSVGGATLRTALEPLARFAGADDHRRRGKRLGDALVELANHCLDAGVLPSSGGRRTHLQVTSSVETLMALPGAPAGDMEFSAPVPATTVQRLACDAGVTRVLLDSKSAVMDVGRARRLPASATRRALHSRDRGCVWPGCDRGVSWTAAHHVQHWANGGATELRNLVLLCHRHHWMVHEGGWQLVRDDQGRVLKIPPRRRGMLHDAKWLPPETRAA